MIGKPVPARGAWKVWRGICAALFAVTVAANAAFFVDAAKPVSQTRFRWDDGIHGTTPDRAEMFFARFRPGAGARGPTQTTDLDRVSYDELSLVTEFAVDRFSLFVEQPY